VEGGGPGCDGGKAVLGKGGNTGHSGPGPQRGRQSRGGSGIRIVEGGKLRRGEET